MLVLCCYLANANVELDRLVEAIPLFAKLIVVLCGIVLYYRSLHVGDVASG